MEQDRSESGRHDEVSRRVNTSTLILSIIIQVTFVDSFTISPRDIVQAEGVFATFQCQHLNATTIGWIVNGTSLYSYAPPNISTDVLENSINTLTVLALPEYNGTQVWCVALILPDPMSDRSIIENSTKGRLIVQGVPGAVENITVISSPRDITVVWEAPFSLNLAADPDIVYCVDAYTVSEGRIAPEDRVFSDCNILTTEFSYNSTAPDPTEHYQFAIIPRTNVEGSKNGTQSWSQVTSFLVHLDTCVNYVTINITADGSILSAHHLTVAFPNWIETDITTIVSEFNDPHRHCTCIDANSTIAAIDCLNCPLYPFRKYSATVQCRTTAGTSNSSDITISTHGISNHNVFDASSSGESITASCTWDAAFENIITGCLLVIIPDNKSEVPLYKITQTCVQVNVTITGFSFNTRYKASLFEMLGTPPYPVRFPAVTESFLLINDQQSPNQIEESASGSILRSVIVTAGPTKLVISCTHHLNVQGIVVIYHRCEDTNENFELSTAHFHVSQNATVVSIGVEAGCYHVAVFGVSAEYRIEESPAKVVSITVDNNTTLHTAGASKGRTYLIHIFASLFAVSLLVIILLTFGIICKQILRRYKGSKGSDIELKQCEAYEVVQVRTCTPHTRT